jgi:dipeptidyl aminopeptidase/acylaminoacyl peptidase
MSDTHKMESHYLTQLIGPYDQCPQRYVHRSPLSHLSQIRCPFLLLQGTIDRVVPPNQAQTMYEHVKDRGIPVGLVLFEGEGHGWKKAENIARSLRLELSFYGQIFGFVPEEQELEIVPLENWKA